MNKKFDVQSSPTKTQQPIISKQQSVLSFKSTFDLFGAKSKTNLFDQEDRKKRFTGKKSSGEDDLQLKSEIALVENQKEPGETPDNANVNNTLKTQDEIPNNPEVTKMAETMENQHISKAQYMYIIISIYENENFILKELL